MLLRWQSKPRLDTSRPASGHLPAMRGRPPTAALQRVNYCLIRKPISTSRCAWVTSCRPTTISARLQARSMTARGLICAEWNMPPGPLQLEASLLTQAGSGRESFRGLEAASAASQFPSGACRPPAKPHPHDGVASQPRASNDSSMR